MAKIRRAASYELSVEGHVLQQSTFLALKQIAIICEQSGARALACKATMRVASSRI